MSIFPRRILFALVAVVLAGCATGAVHRHASGESHGIDAGKLREVMRGFDAAVRKRVPAETDVHDRWEGVFPAIADAAAELEAAANDLSGHPPGRLELPDRGRFQVLGQSLAKAAADLKEAAARGDADAVAFRRKQVAAACRDCHARFRPDAPGEPEAFAQ